MTHEESNKLIAEFLQLPTVKAQPLRGGEFNTLYNIRSLPRITIPVGSTGINATIQTGLLMARLEQLVFHTSWDWLMRVVEKIYTMVDYRRSEPYYNLTHCFVSTPIDIVYRLVIKFIKWYNTQPK